MCGGKSSCDSRDAHAQGSIRERQPGTERGTHRSQEQVEILKELATLIAARTTRGRSGRASVAVQQCMTQFGLYSDFKMTPQEVNRVANLPEWTTVLEVMIKSRRADLAFRTTKQEQWNQRAQDRQTHKNLLEEHGGTGKFSGKYAPNRADLNNAVGLLCRVRRQGRAL